nr:hypothetical protein [Deltaproteobacteria bacterium]
EQRRNLAASQDRAAAWRTIVDLGPGAPDLRAAFAAAVTSVPHASARHGDAELAARRARSLWLTTLTTLVERNRHRKDPS